MSKRPLLKITVVVFASLAGLCFLFVSGWSLAQYLRNPLKVLDRPFQHPQLVADSTYVVHNETEIRQYHDISLTAGKSDTIRMTISLPAPLPSTPCPVLIILGGLEVGRESLKYIKYHGNNVLIAYQYPYSPTYWYQGTAFSEIPAIRQAVLSVPSQVNALVRWSSQQSWADGNPPKLLGYSFGALFLPAIYHLAQEKEIRLGAGVLAYGGANIYKILKANLTKIIEPVRTLVAWVASAALRPMEPSMHLPSLENRFLVMNGKEDDQIPVPSWQELHRLAPVGSTILLLNEGHMHPRKPDLTERLVHISRQWLLVQGVINP